MLTSTIRSSKHQSIPYQIICGKNYSCHLQDECWWGEGGQRSLYSSVTVWRVGGEGVIGWSRSRVLSNKEQPHSSETEVMKTVLQNTWSRKGVMTKVWSITWLWKVLKTLMVTRKLGNEVLSKVLALMLLGEKVMKFPPVKTSFPDHLSRNFFIASFPKSRGHSLLGSIPLYSSVLSNRVLHLPTHCLSISVWVSESLSPPKDINPENVNGSVCWNKKTFNISCSVLSKVKVVY